MNQETLDKFRMGYVILYKNDGSLFGNAIEKKQLLAGFKYPAFKCIHTEISGGEKHAINISPPISKLVDITQVHKGRYAYLLRYKNEEYEKALRYKVAYFSASLNNLGYDIPGILHFIFKWIKSNNRLVFCSEGAAQALQKVFPNALSGMQPDTCMPAHFLNSNEFEEVWAGIID